MIWITAKITPGYLLLSCLICISCFLVFPPESHGGDQGDLLLILDGSGSMWGRVNKSPKITIAKEVVEKVVQESPDELSLGLMVYGHRRKGDCNDLELMVAPGGDKGKLQSSLQSIMPKGKTPLATSLSMAGEMLKDKESLTTIVLVSDGIETCQGDPCGVAAKLREQGHKVVIHTVGFDVNSVTANQLRCIAEAGGGSYFSADDGTALENALKTAQIPKKEEIAPQEPEKEPEVAQVEPTTITSKKLRLAGPGKVVLKPASWVSLPRYWKLAEVETGEVRASSSQLETRIKEGEYQIIWRQAEHGYNDIPLTAVVNVKSGKTSEVMIDTGLELKVPKGIAKPKWWGLARAGEDSPLFAFSNGFGPHVVPAGNYDLLWRQSEHGSTTVNLGPMEIEAGKLNTKVADGGMAVQAAEWMKRKSPYSLKLIDREKQVVGSWRMFGTHLAPAGHYSLVYRATEHGHSDIQWGEVDIKEHGFTTIPLDSGLIFLHQDGVRPPYRIIAVNLDSGHEITSQNTWEPLAIPPGKYKLDWWESQHNSNRQTLIEEFVIEAGTALELEI